MAPVLLLPVVVPCCSRRVELDGRVGDDVSPPHAVDDDDMTK